jgi:hypothetical protein
MRKPERRHSTLTEKDGRLLHTGPDGMVIEHRRGPPGQG